MSNETKIILIRHGESLGNAQCRVLGHTNMDLSRLGHIQARVTAEHLAAEKIDAIYSSSLLRAYNTAVPHAVLHGLTIVQSDNLREIFVGDWEGLTVPDIVDKWGREVYEHDWKQGFGTFAFPGGESVRACGERFYAEVVRIAKENVGKTLLVVAHGAVIRAFWGMISKISWEELAAKLPFPSNASYSVATFDGERLTPGEYSQDEHLTEVGITKINF